MLDAPPPTPTAAAPPPGASPAAADPRPAPSASLTGDIHVAPGQRLLPRDPSFAPPRLTPPRPRGPQALQETIARLGLDGSLGATHNFNHSDAEQARMWLEAARAGRDVAAPDTRTLRVLIQSLPELEAALRARVVQAALGTRRMSWRHMWLVWEHAPEAREALAPDLAERLGRALSRQKTLRETLPGWLGDSVARITAALRSPQSYIMGWVLRTGQPLEALTTRIGCSPTSQMGREILTTLVAQGPADWWLSLEPERARAWAARWGQHLVRAVASRQLTSLAARAGGRSRLRLFDERHALRAWVDEQLGDPASSTRAWEGMSARAREVHAWLVEDAADAARAA